VEAALREVAAAIEALVVVVIEAVQIAEMIATAIINHAVSRMPHVASMKIMLRVLISLHRHSITRSRRSRRSRRSKRSKRSRRSSTTATAVAVVREAQTSTMMVERVQADSVATAIENLVLKLSMLSRNQITSEFFFLQAFSFS
jgi:hypothetical protein